MSADEAADALGLSGFTKLRFIILPQALTKVIPALVGQFIGLFMDTSLASLVGLFELVSVAKAVINQDSCIQCGRCHVVCEDTSHQAITSMVDLPG